MLFLAGGARTRRCSSDSEVGIFAKLQRKSEIVELDSVDPVFRHSIS